MMQRHGTHVALTALLTATLAMGACGDDEEPDVVTPQTDVATAEASPDVGDITDDYFSDASYVGRTVTVTGTVTKLISDGAFVMAGEDYGDESLLVISAPAVDAQLDKEVTVTGVVRQFGFDQWADEYGLGDDPSPYTDFSSEEVLVVGGTQGSAEPSAASPSAG